MSAKRRKKGLTQKQKRQLFTLLAIVVVLALGYFFPGLFGEEEGTAQPPAQNITDLPTGETAAAVHFIDVGQGDSSLIESGGEYVLIDGGPGSAEDSLAAYLESLGIERFRAVIATHPHEDHIGGLDKVLKRFPADAFYMPDRDATTRCFERMLDEVEAQNLEITIPTPGDVLAFGSVTLEFLSPVPGAEYDDTNDFSIVTRLTVGNESVLFMGDAEKPVERELLDGQAGKLSAQILKLGHHGSSTSSSEDFLRAVNPETAIVSCAKENDYGHPHRETLAALDKLGIDALYTYDGTVVLPLGAAA